MILRRNRDYRLLWSGQTVSAIGSQVSGLALPLLVLSISHSPAQAGLVGAVASLPYVVFSLPAGALVDRWDRRTLMVLCEVGRGINMASIPAAVLLGHLALLQLYAVGLIEGTLFVFFNSAETASLTRIVGVEDLGAATAQNEAIWGVSALLGPPLGGFLFQTVARFVPFLVDALSYAVSGLSLLLIRARFSTERGEPEGNLWAQIAEGLRWLRGQPFVRFVALFSAAGDFLFSAVDLVLIVTARQLMHASPVAIGLIFTTAALGGIIGSLLGGRVQRSVKFSLVVIGTSWLIALLYPLFAVVSAPFLLGVVWALIAVAVSVSNTVRFSYRLALIPEALQGRVNSVSNLAAYGSLPIGRALTGVLLQDLGPRPTILLIAGCLAGLAVWATVSRAPGRAPQ